MLRGLWIILFEREQVIKKMFVNMTNWLLDKPLIRYLDENNHDGLYYILTLKKPNNKLKKQNKLPPKRSTYSKKFQDLFK